MRYFHDDGNETGDGVNWPQTFVALGVVSVAAWGLWFFLRDKSDAPGHAPAPPAHDASGVTPGPDPGILVRAIDPVTGLPLGPLPVPLPPSGPKGIVFLAGDPLPLKQGQRYRARLQLTGFQASLATRELVQGQFLSHGFSDVVAFRTASELPSDWPNETRQGGSGVWWVQGIWNGPTGPVAREEPIKQVWEA